MQRGKEKSFFNTEFQIQLISFHYLLKLSMILAKGKGKITEYQIQCFEEKHVTTLCGNDISQCTLYLRLDLISTPVIVKLL